MIDSILSYNQPAYRKLLYIVILVEKKYNNIVKRLEISFSAYMPAKI